MFHNEMLKSDIPHEVFLRRTFQMLQTQVSPAVLWSISLCSLISFLLVEERNMKEMYVLPALRI